MPKNTPPRIRNIIMKVTPSTARKTPANLLVIEETPTKTPMVTTTIHLEAEETPKTVTPPKVRMVPANIKKTPLNPKKTAGQTFISMYTAAARKGQESHQPRQEHRSEDTNQGQGDSSKPSRGK